MGGYQMTKYLKLKVGREKKPFHYKGCGLDDIYLLSGYKIEQTAHGEGVLIKNISGLHKAIGCFLATQKKTLNAKELRFLRKHMDLTQSELGKLVGLSSQQVARWEKGESEITSAAENLIRVLFIEEFRKNSIKVRDLLELLEVQDDLDDGRYEFEITNHGWKVTKKAA